MDIVQYLYIIPTIALLAIFGRMITKDNFASSLLSGLLVISSIIAVTSRYIPAYNLLIVKGLLVVGVLLFLYEIIRNTKLHANYIKNNFLISRNNLIAISVIALIFAIYLISFHYQFLPFESHSVLYFAPSFEILKADYMGNLRVSTYYPSEFSAMHLIPSAAVSVVGFLNPNPNLAYFTEIRYILAIIFFTNFVYSLYVIFKPNPWKLFFICLLVFGIYGAEINYNLYVSSFIYVFVIFEIFLRVLKINLEEKDDNCQRKALELLFFATMLIICKAPIFYMAGAFAFYIWWKNKELRFAPLTIFGGILVLANMYSWLDMSFISTQAISNASKFTLKGGFEFKGMVGWSLNDSIKNLIELGDRSRKVTGFLILFYIIAKYYAVFLFITLKGKKFKELPFFDKSLVIYTIVSLVGILAVRNNEDIGHQAHAYFLMSTLSIAALIVFLLKIKLDKYIKTALITVFIIYSLPTKFFGIILPNRTTHDANNYKYLKYEDANLQDDSQESYIINDGEPYWKSELNSMLSGLRIKSSDTDYIDYGQIRHWIIGAEDKIIYCTPILEKCSNSKELNKDDMDKCEYCSKQNN